MDGNGLATGQKFVDAIAGVTTEIVAVAVVSSVPVAAAGSEEGRELLERPAAGQGAFAVAERRKGKAWRLERSTGLLEGVLNPDSRGDLLPPPSMTRGQGCPGGAAEALHAAGNAGEMAVHFVVGRCHAMRPPF